MPSTDHLVRETDAERESSADRVLDGARLRREHRRVTGLDRHDRRAEVHVAQLTSHDGEHGQRVGTEDLRRPHAR